MVLTLACTAMQAVAPSLAQPVPSTPAATLGGTVVDVRGRPVAGATAVVSGTGRTASVLSAGDGSFRFALAAGVYDVVVHKGGYRAAETRDVALLAGASSDLRVTLVEATTADLRVIGSVSARGGAPSSSVASISSLPSTTLGERQSVALQDVLPQIAGVTFSRGQSADPYEFFAVRGALTETRVQIDGHPLSLGSQGKFDLNEVDPQVFAGADVFKGAGVEGVDAGESVFGTLNLRTRDFSSTNRYVASAGIDGYGAQDSIFAASGNLLTGDRLSYVLDYNVAGKIGPEDGIVANEVLVDPANASRGVVAFALPLDDRVRESSQLAKLRYRLSDATSLAAAFVGFQGTQDPQGIAYGTSVGNITLEPSIGAPNDPKSVFTAPHAQPLDGSTVRGYQWFPGTVTSQNEPFFEAELRTTLGNDTLLLRPYTGVVTRIVDANKEALFPDGQFGAAWSLVRAPSTCSAALPCYVDGGRAPVANAANVCAAQRCYQPQLQTPYDEIEVNRLHGTTFTYLHPLGAGLLNVTYDYHSDFTYQNFGNPLPAANTAGTVSGNAYQIAVAPTTAKNNDVQVSATLAPASSLRVALGYYLTNWNLEYQIEDPAVAARHPGIDILNLPIALVPRSRGLWHGDPHAGVNWRASRNLSLRASAGSGITVPYAAQVSGLPSVTNPSGTTNGLAVLQDVNPNLNPETTVAYDLGADVAMPARGLLSADVFDDTIHNAFVQSIFPVTAAPPASGQRAYGLRSQWLNGPLERFYGLELTLRSAERARFDYLFSGTIERAYYDGLRPQFYASGPSSAINGAQIAGVSQIPYAQVHGEAGYAFGSGTHVGFGADYTGTNNWTYGPAFTTFFATASHPLGWLGTLRVGVDNLFGYGNGDPYGIAIQNGGFKTVLLGPSSTGPGLVYSAQSQPLQSIVPRTFRFSLEKRIGTRG